MRTQLRDFTWTVAERIALSCGQPTEPLQHLPRLLRTIPSPKQSTGPALSLDGTAQTAWRRRDSCGLPAEHSPPLTSPARSLPLPHSSTRAASWAEHRPPISVRNCSLFFVRRTEPTLPSA